MKILKNISAKLPILSVAGTLATMVVNPAQAGMINRIVLNDGAGNGANPGDRIQPIGLVGTGINPLGNPFNEPEIADGTNASSFTFTTFDGIELLITEGTFDTTNGITSLLSSIDTTSSDIDFESSNTVAGANGTVQGQGRSNAFGVDTDTTINNSSNTVLLFDLTSGTPASEFSFIALDLEGGAPNEPSARSFIALYDASGNLTDSLNILSGRHKILKSRANQGCSPKTSLIISAFLGT